MAVGATPFRMEPTETPVFLLMKVSPSGVVRYARMVTPSATPDQTEMHGDQRDEKIADQRADVGEKPQVGRPIEVRTGIEKKPSVAAAPALAISAMIGPLCCQACPKTDQPDEVVGDRRGAEIDRH